MSPANDLTLQGRGLAKGRCQEALGVRQGDLQRKGGIQDQQSATRDGLPSSLWTDFQFADSQLAREFNTAGTHLNYSHCPKTILVIASARWFEVIHWLQPAELTGHP